MRYKLAAAALGAAWLAAPAAFATDYKLDAINITGVKSIPVATLYAVTAEKPGTTVTTDQILADQDAISKALEKANVVGGIATQLVGPKPNGHFEVNFVITDNGVQAPTVVKVAPKLDAQIIDGNVSLTTDALIAATGLKPGEDMTNEKIAAAQQAISAAYKAAKLPLSVGVSGETKMLDGGKVDLLWHVVESKPKKKKRDTDDEGGLQTE